MNYEQICELDNILVSDVEQLFMNNKRLVINDGRVVDIIDEGEN